MCDFRFKKYGLECDNHQSLSVCYDYQNIYYTVYKPMESKRVYSGKGSITSSFHIRLYCRLTSCTEDPISNPEFDEFYNSNELIPEKKENNVIDYLLKFM